MIELEEKLIKLGMKKNTEYGEWNYFFSIDLEVMFNTHDNQFVILHEGGELCSSKDSQLIYNILHDIKQCEITG